MALACLLAYIPLATMRVEEPRVGPGGVEPPSVGSEPTFLSVELTTVNVLGEGIEPSSTDS